MKTIVDKGHKYVLVPAEAWGQIASGAVAMPPLPPADAQGNREALAFARATIARGIIRDRVAAGLSQAELARRAGLQASVLNRIEKAKVIPDESTVKKIDAALAAARKRAESLTLFEALRKGASSININYLANHASQIG